MLKIIKPRLKELYKIKIGIKGNENANGNRLPQKLDHFVILKNEKDNNNNFLIATNIMSKLEKKPRVLPVMLLYNNLEDNFFSSLAYYTRSKLVCSGDGEIAKHYYEKTKTYIENKCLFTNCKFFKQGLCKPSGILKCILLIDGQIGNAAVFRTHAWNTIKYLTSSIQTLLILSGGNIAGVPLWLSVSPETRIVAGKQRIIFTVSLEFQGTIEQLKSGEFIRTEIPKPIPELQEDPADIVDEFYPGEKNEKN